jgi:hypothetical protein
MQMKSWLRRAPGLRGELDFLKESAHCMLRLSDIAENTVFPQSAYASYPGAQYAFFGVAGMVPLIRNSFALMAGPAVCLDNAKLNINFRPFPISLIWLDSKKGIEVEKSTTEKRREDVIVSGPNTTDHCGNKP